MAESDSARLLVFVAEGRRYGFPLESVLEIVPYRKATRLPGAPGYVVGLINLRGRLVTVTNLALQLGSRTASSAHPTQGSIILLESGAKMIGVLVDEVRDVRPVATGAVEPIQRDNSTPGMLHALARFDDGVVSILGADAVVAHVLL